MAKDFSSTPRPKRAGADTAKNGPEGEKIERYRWLLNQNMPIIGSWMHRRVLLSLTESALRGNPHAVDSLAHALVEHDDPEVKKLAAQTLSRINFATGIDAAWRVWVETRDIELEKILLEHNRVAGNPASVRLLSALRLDDFAAVTRGSSDLMPALINACHDRDPLLSERARSAIQSLKNQSSVDVICRHWAESRSPFLTEVMQSAGYVAQKPPRVRVLSALKVERPEIVINGSAEMVAPLVEACSDPDSEIASRAQLCLLNLQKQPAIDAFCQLWHETRAPLLEETLLKAGYVARESLEVRLLAALKTGQMTIAQNAPPDGLPHLFAAMQDEDEVIRQNARYALEHLQQEETREALCLRVIQSGDPLAKEIALTSRCTPQSPEMRALFYFLTEQWQAYDELDFDQSLMRAIYEASNSELRQRISAAVQSAGRTDYLTILAGVDYRSRAEQVTESEASLLVKILAENEEWERLWLLAPELAIPYSKQIMEILVQAEWLPRDEIDLQVFVELAQLIREPMLLSGPELTRALPLALPRANLKVQGRVNEVAFSPVAPLLAIASSQHKVVLWNFQTAKVEHVIEAAFTHSVGNVAYTPEGVLICAERSTSGAICTIFVYQDGASYHLCHHEGTVTALEAVGSSRLLTTGRDQKVALWDLASRKLVAEKEFPFWVRSGCISPDGQYAALLHDKLSLVRLPDLTIVPGQPFIAPRANVSRYKKGVAQNASFSPDGKYILTGQYNGQVAIYFHNSLTQRPTRSVVTEHSQPVRGVHFLPGHPILVTAGAEGQIRFLRWPEMNLLGTVHSPGGMLTSLHVSRSGNFMATGTNEASIRLWDLRVLDIPDLFSQPLATATHDQVSTVLALGEYETLPPAVRNSLKFMRLLLQYRFRFDIQIEEAPIIQFGEFDIMLDEVNEEQPG